MITRNALRAIALATSCLAPVAAYAQAPASAGAQPPGLTIGGTPFTGDLGLGLMGVMGRNPGLAGRYNGLNTTGINLLGDFSLLGRDPWNSGGTRYYEIEGDHLVFQTGNNFGSGVGSSNGLANSTRNSIGNQAFIGIRAGDQGTWGIEGYYNAITYTGNVIDSLYTVVGNRGYLNNNLIPWGGATASAAGTTFASQDTPANIGNLTRTLNNAMLPLQTGTRRDIVGGNFKYIWNDWTFTGAFRHEHKEGTLEESIYQGGFVPQAFGLPVNYDTDRYDATAAYNTHLFQGIFQYTFSHFTDNNLFVSLPFLYSNTAKPFQESSAYSLPPSNSAHYVTMMLATNAVPYTRLNLNARVGVEKQDSTFPPNTADPNPAGAPAINSLNPMLQGTTATSPDITATVYQVKASANTHPFPNLDGQIFYSVDGRSVDLNTRQVYTGGTGGEAADAIGAAALLTVVPQDWLKQAAGAEVTYRVLPQYNTRVSLGYRLDRTDRSNAQVGHSATNTASFAVMSDFGPQVNGRLAFDYSSRSGNLTYLGPWVFLGQGVSYSGAYYQAPMTAESVTARIDYQPLDKVSTDFFVRFRNENYTYPAATAATGATVGTIPLIGTGTGLKQDYRLSIGPDVNYRPMKNVDIHLFYTFDELFFNNLGNGACSTSNTGACAGSAGYFQNKDTSITHTVGLSGEYRVNEKLKLRADYTLSYGSVMFTEFNGVFVANPSNSYQNVANYPDITSVMNSIKLTASYELRQNVELLLQGIYYSFHNNDWNNTANAVQTYGATNTSILLTPGYNAPNWNVAMIMGGMRIKF